MGMVTRSNPPFNFPFLIMKNRIDDAILILGCSIAIVILAMLVKL